MKKLNAFYDRFAKIILSDKEIDRSTLIKTRALLILWTATTTIMWLYVLYCFLGWGSNYPVPWGGLIFSIIHTTVPLIFYLTQSYLVSGLVLSLSGLGFQTLFCIYTGGVFSPAAIWLALHPVILGFFGNTRLIISQIVLNSIIVISLYLCGFYGILPPNILPDLFRDGMVISSYIGLDFLVAIFTIAAIKTNNEKNYKLHLSRELTENLLRVLSHDINNPLSIIRMSSSQLGCPDCTYTRNIERIKKASEDIQQLTTSLGLWMAYRDGKITLSPSIIPITEIIEHIQFSFEDQLKEKQISINISQSNDELTIFGDRQAVLHQIFSNVISNAIKFSYKNSTIDVSFRTEDSFVIATIRDYGVGIDEQIIDKIFSPYDRTTCKGTKNERGTGFGLPIVGMLINQMNGKISVENVNKFTDSQKGSQVIIHLPKA